MNVIIFIGCLFVGLIIIGVIASIQDEHTIKSEIAVRQCKMTECYFNRDFTCISLSDSWNPDLLDECPNYTED